VDLTNLQRQILHTADRVGLPKVESGRSSIHALNPNVEVVALQEKLGGAALDHWIAQCNVVLDCSDNFATRHAVNRSCVRHGVPLVSGAAIRFDGQLAVFDPRDAASPCYHCLFPEAGDVEAVQCATMGVFAPLTGIIGTMQAAEALKLVAQVGVSLAGRLLLLDARTMEWTSIRVPRDSACTVCGAPVTLS
jgi:adenylyltransferase/sulfurtransferase